MKKTYFSLFLAFAVSMVPAALAFAEEVGTVTYVEGRVDHLIEGGSSYLPLVAGEKITIGDKVRTKTYSKASITFADGSVVNLGDSSHVGINEYLVNDKGYRVNSSIGLDRGIIRAIVAKTPDKASFDIITPNTSGTVKGSDVFVSYQQSMTNVFVAEGVFKMSNPDFPDVTADVKKGMTVNVPYNAPPKEPRSFIPSELNKLENITGPIIKNSGDVGYDFTKAYVTKVIGPVKIQPKGAKAAHAPASNESLSEGDKVETGDNGGIQINFDNGLVIELKANTQLVVTRLKNDPDSGSYDNEFESGYGKIISKLQKVPKGSSFAIKTPHAVCGVRGTIMYLEILPNLTQSFFEGGDGYVKDLVNGMMTVVPEGTSSTVDGNGNTSDPAPTTDGDRSGFNSGFGDEGGEYGYSGGDDDAPGGALGAGGMSTEIGGTTPGGATEPNSYSTPVTLVENLINDNPGQGGDTSTTTTTADNVQGSFTGKFGQYDSFSGDTDDPENDSYANGSFAALRGPSPWNGEYPGQVSGTYYNLDSGNLLGGEITGTGDDGGNVWGYFGGAGSEYGPDWEGVISALYVDPSGVAGVVFSNIAGTSDQGESGSFTGSGDVYYIPFENTEFLPEDLSEAIVDRTDDGSSDLFSDNGEDENNSNDIVIENKAGTLEFDPFTTYQSVGTDATWGIFEVVSGGVYDASEVGSEWTGVFGNSGETYYELGVVEGIDDMSGFLRLDIVHTHLSYQEIWTHLGTLVGTYDDTTPYYYEGIGTGIWTLNQLAWSGSVESYYNFYDIEYDSVISGEENAHMGIIGAIESPFDSPGTPVNITLLGESHPDRLMSWWGSLYGSEAGDGSSIPVGIIAGRTNSITGFLTALYIDTDGNAGILNGDFSGEYYDSINQWIAEGAITATQMASGYTSEDYDYDYNYYDGLLSQGGFDAGGNIFYAEGKDEIRDISNGSCASYTAWLIDQDDMPEGWGIFNTELGGYFDGETSDNWYLSFAGNEWTGLYEEEFWMGTIDGTLWTEDGELSGNARGYLFHTSDDDEDMLTMGTFSGKVTGSYGIEGEPTVFEGIAAGEWVELAELEMDVLGFDMETLNDFVSIPITEINSGILTGAGNFTAGGAITGAVMDVSFYSNEFADLWAAYFTGNYSDPTGDDFTIDLTNGDISATLTGESWEDNQWLAGVDGRGPDGMTFTGQAGGTYTDDGTFTGVGAGTLTQPGSELE